MSQCGPYVSPEGGEIEVTLVVKAAPERSKKYNETVCTAAVFDDGRLVRLYPVPWDVYRRGDFGKWTRVRVKVVPSDEPAARPESHKLLSPMVPLESPLKGKPTPWDPRTHLLERALSPGGMRELRDIQETNKKSLGVVKVRELLDFRITAPLDEIIQQADYRESPQKKLIGRPEMIGSRIDRVKHVFRYRWRCMGTCCDEPGKAHDMTCEDWELFQSFRQWRTTYPSEEQLLWALKNQYYDCLGQTNLHFFMGTPSSPQRQNSWMIVGLYYPKIKKKPDPTRPTLCRSPLEPLDVLRVDAKYDEVEEVDIETAIAPTTSGQKRLDGF